MPRLTKVVSLVLCAVFALSLVPLNSIAAPVDRKTAADPEAALKALEEMDLEPMPEELAKALRGEQVYTAAQIVYYALVIYGTRLSLWAGEYIAYRWKPGSIYALSTALREYSRCAPCGGGGGGSW